MTLRIQVGRTTIWPSRRWPWAWHRNLSEPRMYGVGVWLTEEDK